MIGLHRSSVERRDNGEAVLLQCAGDVRAVAAVGERRIRRRTATSPVYDDLELFALAQRRRGARGRVLYPRRVERRAPAALVIARELEIEALSAGWSGPMATGRPAGPEAVRFGCLARVGPRRWCGRRPRREIEPSPKPGRELNYLTVKCMRER
jgi:hypothetical protein